DNGLCMDTRESARLCSTRQLLSQIADRPRAPSQTRSASMRPKASLYLSVVAFGAALLLTVSPAQLAAQQTVPAGVTVGESDLGGVVSGPNGPEAGVWVIAETTDLPAKFAKMVVTDDQGRYVLPELPKANYTVWVRGYGLVDSPKLQSAPGKILNLNAVPAANAAAAAEYYPAIYWYS